LVVLLEDFECFSPPVVQQLVEIVSEYARSGLPLVFVFGIALSSDVIHRLVSRSTTRQLHMRDFLLPPPTACLDALFSKVVMSSQGNHSSVLGPRVLAHLVSSFELNSMSVSLFQHAVEVGLMEHALRGHLNGHLTPSGGSEELQGGDLDAVRSLTSVSTLPGASKLLDQELRGQIGVWREEFAQKRVVVVVLWSVVLELLAERPSDEVCAQKARVAVLCLGGVEEAEKSLALEAASNVIKSLSKDILQEHLEAWARGLAKIQGKHIERHTDRLARLISDLSTVDKMAEAEAAKEGQGTGEDAQAAAVGQQLSRKMSASKRRKTMLDAVAPRRPPSVEKLNQIRTQSCHLLRDCIRDSSKALWSSPLNEILVFDDVAALERVLQPEARNLLQSALNDPHKFLHLDEGSPDNIPDLCLLYREVEKKGRLINLQEWFEIFEDYSKLPGQPPAKRFDLQFRFVRSVSELEMLGYLKKTNRRRGHVQANIHV